MFDEKTSAQLDEITLAYREVCLDYIVEVGKIGAGNNGVTIQWSFTSPSCQRLRYLLKVLKNSYKGRSREEKYYLLRELYALKPGVHERFFSTGHDGRVLPMLQEVFESRNPMPAKGTMFLKHLLALENFYELEPFLDVSGGYFFPCTHQAAQMVCKFLMEAQDWKALDSMKPLDSWMVYAACGINEGPIVLRKGLVLFQNLRDLDKIAIGYKELIDHVSTL